MKGLIVGVGFLFFLLAPAHAMKSKPEIYSSLEKDRVSMPAGDVNIDPDLDLPDLEEVVPVKPASKPSMPTKIKKEAENKRVEQMEREIKQIRQETRADKNQKYAVVEADRVDSIASRLVLVEQILRVSGRAYDYRTSTMHELEKILDEVTPSPTITQQETPE